MKRIAAIIGSIVAAILFLFSFIIIIFGILATKNNRIASLFGYSFAAVATDSMEDTISKHSIVIIKKVDITTINELDIIVYYSELNQFYIIHRVQQVLPDNIIKTKGDKAGSTIDPEDVTVDNFQGKVIWYGKVLGVGALFLNHRQVTFLIIIIALVLIIILEIISIVKTMLKKQKEEILKKYKKQ